MSVKVRRAGHLASALMLVAVLLSLALAPVGGAPPRGYAYDGPLENAVADWNRHAFEALGNSPAATPPGMGQPPPVASLHLAMVQGAVYDAVNMIDGGHQPYLAGLPAAPESASLAAAVATAAHDVLVGVVIVPALTPAIVARLGELRDATLAQATAADGPASVAAGSAAGATAAAAMLAERAADGRYVPLALVPGTDPGEWRPELPGFVSDPFAWVAEVDPFTLTSPAQFRTKGPHALTSKAYAKEYNEVKALGARTGGARTPEQEAMAQFFNTNPLEMYLRMFRKLAVDEGLTLVEQANLFARLQLTNADALINCWNDKVYWGFWRPITAIRQGDNDGNPRTAGDATWLPMLDTPPYSDHVSGYNCVTGAFMFAAKAFFNGDRMDFSLTRTMPDGTVASRQYKHFSDLCDDTIDVRVYHGVHFRAADVQGAELGRDVARWVDQHYFKRAK